MNNLTSDIPQEALTWLLDESEPGPRYLTLRDLHVLSADDPEVERARQEAHQLGPIRTLLDKMHPDGYWAEPGPGYNPKYRSAVWAVLTLAQLGARVEEDERLAKACDYLITHSMTDIGQFTAGGTAGTTVDCLQGNLCWALTDLGYQDPRLEHAFDWLGRSITGEGIAPNTDKDAFPRYYAGNCGPGFHCGANNKLQCAWGAVKCLLALGQCPERYANPMIKPAIQAGADFLFSVDPATAAYPTGYTDKPSGNWWKFGFPVFYISDLLQLAQALIAAGFGRDDRLKSTLQLIADKRDPDGRYPLEFGYLGKMWVEFGEKKKPNKWVTIRAYRALQSADA